MASSWNNYLVFYSNFSITWWIHEDTPIKHRPKETLYLTSNFYYSSTKTNGDTHEGDSNFNKFNIKCSCRLNHVLTPQNTWLNDLLSFCKSFCLSACLSDCVSVYLSACLLVHLSTCLLVCLSWCGCHSIFLFICQKVVCSDRWLAGLSAEISHYSYSAVYLSLSDQLLWQRKSLLIN